MIARLSSMLIWSAVAVAAVAWGLKLFGRDTPVPPHAQVATATAAAGADYSRVFGQPQAAAPAAAEAPAAANDARFRLIGVVAPKLGQNQGLALISVDGKTPRTTRLGQEVEPGLVLATVSHRRVELSRQGQAVVALELPALPEPQRGRPGEGGAATAAGLPPGGVPRAPGLNAPAPSPMPAAAPAPNPGQGTGQAVGPMGASPTGPVGQAQPATLGASPVAAPPATVVPDARVVDVPPVDSRGVPTR